MIRGCKKAKHGPLNTVDRFSDLPDFILHQIISFIDRKDAYRTSILSKRWAHIIATNPVLEVKFYLKETSASHLDRIESTMQRYSKENLRIRKLTLDYYRNTDAEFTRKVDEWLGIAICGRLTELEIHFPKIPEILFSAKSLTHLEIWCAKIPYFQAIGLVSLKYLRLVEVVVEDRVLNHIISSCPSLKSLNLAECSGYKTIVIPRWSKLEDLNLFESFPEGASLILETSSLKSLWYEATNSEWPLTPNTSMLRNLRKFEIEYIKFTEEDLAKLLSDLPLLEDLTFGGCIMPKTTRISNTRLKQICFRKCYGFVDVKIDAPILKTFIYEGRDPDIERPDFVPALSIVSQSNCDITLHIQAKNFDTQGFLKLKKLLTGLRSCDVLAIWFCTEYCSPPRKCDDLKFDEEKAGNVDVGVPCEIRKLNLKLNLDLESWILSESSLSAFLDGLLWTCHPDTIYLQVDLYISIDTIKSLIAKLMDMVISSTHPLKRIDVEDFKNALTNQKHNIILILYW